MVGGNGFMPLFTHTCVLLPLTEKSKERLPTTTIFGPAICMSHKIFTFSRTPEGPETPALDESEVTEIIRSLFEVGNTIYFKALSLSPRTE